MAPPAAQAAPTMRRTLWPGLMITVLITIVLVFAARRFSTDIPHVVASTLPDDAFDRRYVEHPWLTYTHIGLAVPYLIGAPLQLSHAFRTRHYPAHRLLGRCLVVLALASTLAAIVFGLLFSFGGAAEALATVVFGAWFILCLLTAFLAIKRGSFINHRRWMIRAFAVGLGAGTIRIWIGILGATGIVSMEASFAAAFWIGFGIHVLGAEWWIRSTPDSTG